MCLKNDVLGESNALNGKIVKKKKNFKLKTKCNMEIKNQQSTIKFD